MASHVNVRVDVDNTRGLCSEVCVLSPLAAEGSVLFRGPHRTVDLTRASTIHAAVLRAGEVVASTGGIKLCDSEAWAPIKSTASKAISSCSVDSGGYTVVIDIALLEGTPIILLDAVRVAQHSSPCALLPIQALADCASCEQQSTARSADVRSRAHAVDIAAWDTCVHDVDVQALRRDVQHLVSCAGAGTAGRTWWCPAGAHPRCLVEQLALEVFERYGRPVLDALPQAERDRSGAEVWVQLRSSEHARQQQSIAFHFDRDESLAMAHGLHAPPLYSTVTYLSDAGAPTLCIPWTREQLVAMLPAAAAAPAGHSTRVDVLASYPVSGKQLVFDGQLLHGCPSQLARPCAEPWTRMSLLVNVWVGHRPLGVGPLPAAVVASMTPARADHCVCQWPAQRQCAVAAAEGTAAAAAGALSFALPGEVCSLLVLGIDAVRAAHCAQRDVSPAAAGGIGAARPATEFAHDCGGATSTATSMWRAEDAVLTLQATLKATITLPP